MANEKKLPDAYYKRIDGNNYKLLHLNELLCGAFDADMRNVLDCLDIYQAFGATLDLYGDMVGQKRGALNDEQYRIVILNAIGRNICKGDYESVVKLVAQFLGCDEKQVVIEDEVDAPCKVSVKNIPFEVIVEKGFTVEEAVEMIEALLPICVKVNSSNFDGTFEFGATATEYDENKGFSDSSHTIGGYLGLIWHK